MKHTPDVSTPAVILEGTRHGSLGIARSLGRLGVPVYLVEGNPLAPARFSRYTRGHFRWNFESSSDDENVNLLLQAGRKIGRPSILMPTTDFSALFVAKNAGPLREWFLFQDMPFDLVQSLSDKKEMFFLAKRLGIPTAQCLFPVSEEDINEYLERARFPVMLKGIDGVRLERFLGRRMFIVETASELLARYRSVPESERNNVMLQEYIPGAPETCWMFNGYFNSQSDCPIGFTGCKIRLFPAYIGATSLGICARNEHVDTITRKFMKAIHYRGILDIGYRYDARDCQYKVLDINPRIGATFRLFVAENGMDVARALYLDLTGQPIEAGEAREGRKWVVEDQDLISSIRYWRDGKLKLREWATSFSGIREGGCWASDDPLPLIGMAILDIAAGLRSRRTTKAD
ncbi:MAG: carboxylate--amine ligase, partial [Acidobacteriota bacterium]|nr:carboxylate--amine ligase [Acidobacteriota bacterium]